MKVHNYFYCPYFTANIILNQDIVISFLLYTVKPSHCHRAMLAKFQLYIGLIN